jgi:hypothetical protein
MAAIAIKTAAISTVTHTTLVRFNMFDSRLTNKKVRHDALGRPEGFVNFLQSSSRLEGLTKAEPTTGWEEKAEHAVYPESAILKVVRRITGRTSSAKCCMY